MSQVPALKLKVEYWPLDKIKPFERNPRIHGEEQIKTLVEAIGLFGFVVPLLVDEDGELIAGHGRLLAAKRAAMTEVPVIRVKHFTEAQRRAYVVADNRIANMAKWDERLLHDLLTEVQDAGLNLEVIGFSDVEMQRLADDLDELMLAAAATFPPAGPITAAPPRPAAPTAQIPQPTNPQVPQAPNIPAAPAPDATEAQAEPPPAATPATPPPTFQSQNQFLPFSCVMEAEQRDVVFEAIRKSKDKHGLSESGTALFAICKEFLDR